MASSRLATRAARPVLSTNLFSTFAAPKSFGAAAIAIATRRYNSSKTSSSSSSASPKTPPPEPKSSSSIGLIVAAAAVAGGAYWAYSSYSAPSSQDKLAALAEHATKDDYQQVYNAIAKRIQDVDDEPDEGSYAPALVRLAWHSSGTWDRTSHTGGSGYGTMRFDKEAHTGANAGLDRAKLFLEPISKQFPWLSHGDLYTLSGVTAIQELGGPTIKWRGGRIDGAEDKVPPDGRLPDASKGADHIRALFENRMGFTEGETVALIGAHALGRCHTSYSGYDGPWTFSPTYFTNDFFKLLEDEKWHVRKWDGPKQYQDDKTKSLMMLPADYSLVQDKEFKKWVHRYATDNDFFFQEFARAFSTLLELGVNFKPNTPYYEFTRLDDQ